MGRIGEVKRGEGEWGSPTHYFRLKSCTRVTGLYGILCLPDMITIVDAIHHYITFVVHC